MPGVGSVQVLPPAGSGTLSGLLRPLAGVVVRPSSPGAGFAEESWRTSVTTDDVGLLDGGSASSSGSEFEYRSEEAASLPGDEYMSSVLSHHHLPKSSGQRPHSGRQLGRPAQQAVT